MLVGPNPSQKMVIEDNNGSYFRGYPALARPQSAESQPPKPIMAHGTPLTRLAAQASQ